MTTSRWLVVVLSILMVTVGISMFVSRVQTTRWEQKVQGTLAVNAELQRQQERAKADADSLKVVAEKATKEAAAAFTRSQARVIRWDTVRVTLGTPPDTCRPWSDLADGYRQEIDSLGLVIDTLGQAVGDQKRRGDRLEVALGLADRRADSTEALLRARPKGCTVVGLLPCPVVVLGAAVGSDGKPRAALALGFPVKIW